MKTALLAIVFVLAAAPAGHAATLEISVKDARGAPVEEAVPWATPKSGPAPLRKGDATLARAFALALKPAVPRPQAK